MRVGTAQCRDKHSRISYYRTMSHDVQRYASSYEALENKYLNLEQRHLVSSRITKVLAIEK